MRPSDSAHIGHGRHESDSKLEKVKTQIGNDKKERLLKSKITYLQSFLCSNIVISIGSYAKNDNNSNEYVCLFACMRVHSIC